MVAVGATRVAVVPTTPDVGVKAPAWVATTVMPETAMLKWVPVRTYQVAPLSADCWAVNVGIGVTPVVSGAPVFQISVPAPMVMTRS